MISASTLTAACFARRQGSFRQQQPPLRLVLKRRFGTIMEPNGMDSSHGRSYEDALKCLNSLQSRREAVEARRKAARYNLSQGAPPEMRQHLQTINVDIDWLSERTIHVAGTKGKGTTCAIAESILRHHGFSTGLYTSPHLITVWDSIMLTREGAATTPAPTWFSFLTLLAFKIFFELKVDASVVEVGIGGRTDATNVLSRPAACGIAYLDYDHMEILGDTLSDIAFEKSGIFKPGATAITVPQEESALRRLLARRAELNTNLFITTPLHNYSKSSSLLPHLAADFQRTNASLALALATTWLAKRAPHLAPCVIPPSPEHVTSSTPAPAFPEFALTDMIVKGIEEFQWPGRAQVMPLNQREILFLDGAHTTESIRTCLHWFIQQQQGLLNQKTILMFHCNKPRVPKHLMAPIAQAIAEGRLSPSLLLLTVPQIKEHKDSSNKLAECKYVDTTWQEEMKKDWLELVPSNAAGWPEVKIEASVNDSMKDVRQFGSANPDSKISTLVFGSLYLVGAVLELFENPAN